MISGFLNSILVNEGDRHLASGDLEDADFIYGGKYDRKTREKVLDEAIDRDLNVKALGFNDLEDEDLDELGEKIQGKKLFYRHKNFTRGLDFEQKLEAAEKLKLLEREYNLDLINDPFAALINDSKKASNSFFQNKLERLENVNVSEQYSLEKAYEKVKKDPVIAKPDQGSLGDGIEKLESVDAIDEYMEDSNEEIVFEEYIPHDREDHIEDRRAYVIDGEVVATVNRKNDEGLATNLAKGGEYVEGSETDLYEEAGLERVAEGLDFAAVDYVKDNKDDEIIVYETNATPGTKYDDKFGGLIDPLFDILDSDTGKRKLPIAA